MKKLLALLLAFVLLLSMAACSSMVKSDDDDEEEETKKSSKVEKEDEEEEEEEEEEKNSGSEEVVDETKPKATEPKETKPKETEPPATEPPAYAFEAIEVVNDDSCSIQITEIIDDKSKGMVLKMVLENKTDTNLKFQIASSSINDVQAALYLYEDVAAGKKSNAKVTVQYENLDTVDIGNFTDIQVDFKVTISGDYSSDPVAVVSTHVYPFGQENAEVYTYVPSASEVILVDNEYATVIAMGYVTGDSYYPFQSNMCVINKTDKVLRVSTSDVSVNGYMTDSYFTVYVQPGKTLFESMNWSRTALEDNDIETVETITMTLTGKDNNDWYADEFFVEEVTLNT